MDTAKLSHGWALALVLWSVIAPLVGILVGHYLTRSWQQKQWVQDRRKEEWSELLTTLTRSFVTICKLTGTMMVLDGDDMRTLDEAQTVAQTTIRDRIFIAKEMKALGIYETWVKAARAFEKDMVYIAFAEQYAVINAKIVDAATKDL
jgi:hypothetical protein